MRISLLDKRENFDKILKATLSNSTFLSGRTDELSTKFYINRYLNFIATNKLPTQVFQVLKNEYSFSTSIWKSVIQKQYVHLAIKPALRKILSHRAIELPSFFSAYLILGGNHRIRLFSNVSNATVVILKKGERHDYIERGGHV